MAFVFVISLLLIGVIAASGFVENKIPQSKVGLGFIKPYGNWIGLVAMVLGLYFLFKVIIHLGTFLKYVPIALVVIKVASYLIMVVLGFLLAQSLFAQFTGKNEKVDEMLKAGVDKFGPLTEKLGLAAIAAGLLNLLLYIT
jgi:hypothetical protein